MTKYKVYTSETVYYMKEVEAESEEHVKDMVFDGEIDFDSEAIYNGHGFNIIKIEEI